MVRFVSENDRPEKRTIARDKQTDLSSTGETHFERLAHWLKLESAAETERIAERRRRATSKDVERSGETLLDLAIDDHQTGLGGRYLLTLVKRNRTLHLPWNRLRVGSPVVLSTQGTAADETYQGVVSARNTGSIQVAVQHWPNGDRFRIDLSADEVTRRRQKAAMKTAEEARGRLGQLRDVLLGERQPSFGLQVVGTHAEPEISSQLDQSQQDAIRFALTADDVAIIHGPPGTGKTTTVVELIRQAVLRGEKVLACAPSNTAVDNLVERLADSSDRVVRLGHPARVSRNVREHTLDAMVERGELMEVVRDMIRESDGLFRKMDRYTRSKPPPGMRQEMRREAKRLKTDARMLERQAIGNVLDQADVLCATTTFNENLIGDRHFDLVVIDEACQGTEPGCWLPLLYADRIVLAGDHFQLPPTVLSAQAAREGFTCSLLERLVQLYGDQITRRLTVQYRMHEQIMRFSSDTFYDGGLEADASVVGHRLSDLPEISMPGAETNTLTDEPVTFIDTAGAGWDEELEPEGLSKLNTSEGQLVLQKVDQLLESGLAPSDIAVIAPYAAQVRWLRQHCESHDVEIDTVDGFQGREKEAVVITLVRSNQTGEIGFLADTRRMNVALTRARRKLIVIGDSATLGGHTFYASLLEYIESIDAYHTVWEEG